MNASTLRAVGRLHNPSVTLRICLFDLQIMCVEFIEFIRQDVGFWNKVILTCTKLFLRPDIVVTKAVFSSDFVTLREMINPLIFVKTFIQE
jgi:hypothetical protein